MSFSIDPISDVIRPRVVWYSSDAIRISVGEVARERGIWVFHHHNAASGLTEAGKKEMLLSMSDMAIMNNVVERLRS